MTQVLDKPRPITDFEKVNKDPEYTREAVTVENTTAGAVDLKGKAYPCKAGSGAGFVEIMTAVESQTPANIVGFLVTGRLEQLPATSGKSMGKYAMLTNGPAVVDEAGFADVDLAGAAYSADDFKTALAAMSPFVKVAANAGLKSVPYKHS